jgi:glycosyltransferase involved in cell wall biosynthesis
LNENDMTMHEKLRVLVAAPLPPPDYGGICNWSRIIRAHFADSPEIDLHFVDTKARYRDVTNHGILARLTSGSLQASLDICYLRHAFRTKRPGIFHLCTSGGLATPKDILVLRMAHYFGIPSVIHYHMGRLPDTFKQKGYDWNLTSRAMTLADVVITLDEQSEKCVKADIPYIQVLSLPNMVEIAQLDAIRRQVDTGGNSGKTKRIVYAGQVMPTKGIKELVQACGQLGGKNFVLELVGPVGAKFKEHLTSLASAAGAPEWLHFVGPINHEQALLHIARADIFTLPSYSEGAPNVILEAMALGCSIVSTTVGAVPQMLDFGGPEECGICVPPRDVDALKLAISKLLENSKTENRMGEIARARAKRLYDVPVACGQLANVWKNLAHRSLAENLSPKQKTTTVMLVAPLPPPDYGGIANWSRILSKNLAESPHWHLRFINSMVRYRKVTNHSFVVRLIGGSFHACNTIYSFYQSVRWLRPQLVHICTSGGLSTPRNIISLLIARHFGIPAVIHYRMGAIPKACAKDGMEWHWTLRAMKLAEVVITLDRRSEACVRKCLPTKRVMTLPNMVEVDVLDAICAKTDVLSKKSGGFNVAYAGQILPTKGIAELVEACAKFADRGLHLNLAGPIAKDFHAKLTHLAADASSADWLHFYGPQHHDEAICILAGADLIAMPSYSEGFPNMILEAMVLSKAILASDVGAIPEMLDIGGEEECGIVVPPRKVEPLASALERLMDDPPFRLQIGKKARQRAERLYSVPAACFQLTDMWESVLHSKKSE